MKAKLIKQSICDCGFPALKDVPLGTIYDVDPDKTEKITWGCGGCFQMKHNVKVIWVHERAGARAGYLPEEIFRIGPLVPAQGEPKPRS